jgi:hypothetical protein
MFCALVRLSCQDAQLVRLLQHPVKRDVGAGCYLLRPRGRARHSQTSSSVIDGRERRVTAVGSPALFTISMSDISMEQQARGNRGGHVPGHQHRLYPQGRTQEPTASARDSSLALFAARQEGTGEL